MTCISDNLQEALLLHTFKSFVVLAAFFYFLCLINDMKIISYGYLHKLEDTSSFFFLEPCQKYNLCVHFTFSSLPMRQLCNMRYRTFQWAGM